MTDYEIDKIPWDDLIPKLHAYAKYFMNIHDWFRGPKTRISIGGKNHEDYVNEAIEIFLYNPEKYNPGLGTLENFLKFYIIRSLISNDSKLMENRTSSSYDQIEEKEEPKNYKEIILPGIKEFYDDEIDYHEIMTEIEKHISDKIMENLFLGICCYNMERKEVIAEFNISEKDYDNGVRRLKTILKNVAKKYNLKE